MSRWLPMLLTLCPLSAWGAPDGPPYFDRERNLEKQQEAAREAKAAVKANEANLEQLVAYLGGDSAIVRDAVFDALVEQADANVARALFGQLGSRDPFVAGAVAELCGALEVQEARGALEKVALSQAEPVALEAIRALERLGGTDSTRALKKVIKKRREFRVKGDALIALATLDPEEAREEVEDALEDKLPPIRIAALLALRAIDPTAAAEAAVAVIAAEPLSKRERAWEPRLLFAALETLELWTERASAQELAKQAVEALIARLPREEGRPLHELGLLLQDLTGEVGLPAEAEIWQGWWEARRETFEVQDKQLEIEWDRSGLPERRPPQRPVTGDEGGTRVRFHGIPVESKRLAFAQDVSGGMNNPLDRDDPDSPAKMEFSKQELVRVLEAMPDDTLTSVIFFATEYYRPAEQLIPLGPNRSKLVEFVQAQETPDISAAQNRHKSRSNLFDTLAFALEDPSIDTVFFLSEGAPNEGRWVDWDRFLIHLARLNRYARVRVHCLQVSTEKSGTRFLRRLAATSGGAFYDLDTIRKAHQ